MRGAALVFFVACGACMVRSGSDDRLGSPDHCQSDSACSGGDVCARTGACLPPSQVRAVHVTWTVSGKPANATTCTATPDLRIEFTGAHGEPMSYAPVPCAEGKFSVDKLPTSFDHVGLGRASGGGWQQASIGATTGEAMIDLPFGTP